MEDVVQFKKRLESLCVKYYDGNVCLLPFLDEAQIQIAKEICKKNYVDIYFDGKILNSERKRAIMSMYDINPKDYKIVVYKIDYNKNYYELNHRAILGALMNLGIKRSTIGDIVTDDNKNWYFATTEEIKSYLEEEFKSVSKAPIKLILYEDVVENIIKYETKGYFVSSLRLDCIIAQAYKLSRSEALEIIMAGNVFVNQKLNQNPSHNLIKDDVISVRHKGKIKLESIGNTSKSGRIYVDIARRV